jgi:LCP family protein required for cell wall assembly
MARGKKNRSSEPAEVTGTPVVDDSEYDEYDDDDGYRYRRSNFQRLILAVGVLTVLGCITAVAAIAYEAYKLDQIERKDVALAAASDDEPQNWLIVGSDSRDVITKNDPNAAVFNGGGETTGGQRSDTIMVVRVDPKGEHLDILSLQRDLWLPIARTGSDERINSAYSYPDGAQRLIDTIKLNFNIEINHYAEINFASFEGIVNAIGGVPMYFDKPMHDLNSGLDIQKAGCVNLDGFQALAFARSRHLQYSDGVHWVDDPSGDLGRISRQQYFMRKMFDRAGSKAFSNPKVTDDLINVARQYIGIDKQIDITKVIAMGQRFGTFKGESIKSYSLPVSPFTTSGGAAVLRLDAAGSQPILNRFRGLPEGDAAPETVKFTVENGSGTSGQAAEVQRAFQAVGYGASGAKDHGSIVAKTEVHFPAGGLKTADQIARHLTSGAELVPDPNLAADKFVLVTGKDFTTVMKRPRDPAPATADTTGGTGSTSTTAAGKGATTTTVKGAKTSSSTTTTAPAPALNNDNGTHVGVVPGEPPAGVTCS